MKLYIASRSQESAKQLKAELESRGHQISARWITQDSKFGHTLSAYTDEERTALAIMDEVDVRASDALVLIADPEGKMVPGGKHVETGIALALNKHVYVLGRKENIFHWHPLVIVVTTAEELFSALHKSA